MREKEAARYEQLDLRFRILERTVRLSKLEDRVKACVKSPEEARIWQAGATRVRSEILRLELKLENILASKE